MNNETIKTGDKIQHNGKTLTAYRIGNSPVPQEGALLQIGPSGQEVRIAQRKGEKVRFAVMDGFAHPEEICSLAAGRDAWMRKICFRCKSCKTRQPLTDMECGHCLPCYEQAGEENAAQDNA